MRSRSNSTVRLDSYYRIVLKTILQHQNPVTGLLPASEQNPHAWIRDNVYCITGVWALSLAFKKTADLDEDRAKAYELGQATVKCMRGLLTAMMRQRDRIERFKESFSPMDSIHAKFSSSTGLPVVGDREWGHLQIDAISLYLLTLSQMTASGLQCIFTLDEVSFVQNLVFFIESAYCTPDYGIWERGDKSNTGIVELNASSIGMAKAALEAIDELDLFGARGGPSSVIHVMADEVQKCRAVLESMLPRESLSKEVDAALLTVVGFPAFAVEDAEVIKKTCDEVISKLGGRYGCRRFLRDGYKNPREDSTRLHYEPWELRLFENIEGQWPLFFCYLVINSFFQGDFDTADRYSDALSDLMIKSPDDGLKLMPEVYSVRMEDVTAEEINPCSQQRVPVGRLPFMWAQSLHVIGRLLLEKFVAPGELDPINRRLSTLKKPDVVVQVVVLAKDRNIQNLLASHDIQVKTIFEASPIEVHPAKVLSTLYTYLGRNEKLGLTGRKSKDIGILATSKLYKIQDKIFAFTPQRFDVSRNYMDCDISLMMTTLEYGLNYLSTCWGTSGRPVLTLILGDNMLENGKVHPAMMSTLRKLNSGYISGTRVSFGTYDQFMSTSCVTNLSFLGSIEDGQPEKLLPQVEKFLVDRLGRPVSSVYALLKSKVSNTQHDSVKRKLAMKGSIKRSRSLRLTDANAHRTQQVLSRPLSGGNDVDDQKKSLYKREESVLEFGEGGAEYYPNSEMRQRFVSESQYGNHEVDELVQMLTEAHSLDEQGDILHYLVNCYGIDYEIKVLQTGEIVKIRDLLRTLYEAACAKKNWGIVRHAAGYLGKRVEDLSKSVTDLLVRQKQVTVGMPAVGETTISGGQLTSTELRHIIHAAYNGDESTAMLSQELLVYLAMLIQTEPQLFHGMLRLRIGLIIQVMATELARSLKIRDEDATEELINLSPFEMRNLLHHIMSGREFGVHADKTGYSIVSDQTVVSKKYIQKVRRSSRDCLSGASEVQAKQSEASAAPRESDDDDDNDSDDSDRQGSWMRRRRLDGALNRVPLGFYTKVWKVLEKCQAIQMQGKHKLEFTLTQEMTSNEMKFALQVEGALNTIPQPDFRQLMVEALMVLALIVEYNIVHNFGGAIYVEEIVRTANTLFLQDQFAAKGDATLCCAISADGEFPQNRKLPCEGNDRICRHFYDSAPSGTYGTMAYLVRACCIKLDAVPKEGDIDCQIS